MTPAPPPKPVARSTPQKCAGSGAYDQAVDCFRMASAIRFNVDAPSMAGDGEVKRPRIGQEHVEFSLRDGKWVADTKPAGIVWTRDGQKATPSPELERLHQRLTLFLDPQKKEGLPALVAMEPLAGTNAFHYHFTDANNGEPYDVWTSTEDGHIMQMKVGTMLLTFK